MFYIDTKHMHALKGSQHIFQFYLLLVNMFTLFQCRRSAPVFFLNCFYCSFQMSYYDFDWQGSTGQTGLKGEVCYTEYIHYFTYNLNYDVYCSCWCGLLARKGQQEIQGREVKKVKWVGLDSLVSQAHPAPEGHRGILVLLAHLDLKWDLYVWYTFW